MEQFRSRALGWLLMLIPLLTACRPAPLAACDAAPALADTASTLAACLAPAATPDDAERLLRAWARMGGEWGGVTQADVLLAPGQELLVRFHAELSQVIWNPQGQFVVLAHDGAVWRVVFDAASLRLTTPRGETWRNWRYQAPIAADLTGDGLDDHDLSSSQPAQGDPPRRAAARWQPQMGATRPQVNGVMSTYPCEGWSRDINLAHARRVRSLCRCGRFRLAR